MGAKQRVPRTRGGGKYTESQFFGFIRAGLRAKSNRWPPKYAVLAKAKRKYEGANKRQKFEYQCNACKGWYAQKEVCVDHIVPAGTLKSFDDLPGFCERLFCEEDGLQVMCDTCHDEKTKNERNR